MAIIDGIFNLDLDPAKVRAKMEAENARMKELMDNINANQRKINANMAECLKLVEGKCQR